MIKKNIPDFKFENELKNQYSIIAGVDEVGRGCLAGPVFAACTNLNFDEKYLNIGINDSKLLSYIQRESIFKKFEDMELDFELARIDSQEIDKINILQASKKAMLKAIAKLKIQPNFILVDGNQKLQTEIPQLTIIKGDSKSLTIASASILAKCKRDEYLMTVMHDKYPKFGFDKHKGYATKEHFKALEKYGETEFHRKTFLRKFYDRQLSIF